MLQQILKEMYIDPDVLNALNDDQKKTLFLKMRQEQVRRWKEREEKLEKEERSNESKRPKARKANSKNVSWMPGRDGDVAVIVIGEVDELTSKFICSGLGEKKTPNPQNNTHQKTILKSRKNTEPDRRERENLPPKTQPGISLNLKGKSEETAASLPLPVSVSEHSAATEAEKTELKSAGATEEKSLPQPSICSRPPKRTSPVNVRPASANVEPGYINTRPGLTNLRLAAASPPSSTVKTDPGMTSPTKSGLHSREAPKAQESHGSKNVGASETFRKAPSEEAGTSGNPPVCAGRGRVAQLMKTFSVDTATSSAQSASRGIKPPLPNKPSHLRVTTTPTVR
ncbi:SH2 domain-containing protein 4A [Salarias fasciatus]|uniref:SH2 domain-containing protein 4A-like n=1 Tax=Salarias fasciatus TaxID=181472 RepID=A0A672GZA8_SALFA|nr:SH2 domain-containing protein 4A-like [Salarias fasciatus]